MVYTRGENSLIVTFVAGLVALMDHRPGKVVGSEGGLVSNT